MPVILLDLMYVDIVFPSKNETDFINLAYILGYTGLCLAYPLKDFSQKKIDELKLKSPIKLYGAVRVHNTNKKIKSDIIISEAKNEEYNRQTLEKGKVNVLFNLENKHNQDFIHQRNSGLNQIFCKLASKNNKVIGISFSNLLNSQQTPLLIGRIAQNIKLCNKYGTQIILASFTKNPYELRPPIDLRSFLISMGSNNQIAKKAITNLSEILETNKTKIAKHISIE